jgi:hypothetical protein
MNYFSEKAMAKNVPQDPTLLAFKAFFLIVLNGGCVSFGKWSAVVTAVTVGCLKST